MLACLDVWLQPIIFDACRYEIEGISNTRFAGSCMFFGLVATLFRFNMFFHYLKKILITSTNVPLLVFHFFLIM